MYTSLYPRGVEFLPFLLTKRDTTDFVDHFATTIRTFLAAIISQLIYV